MNLNFEVVFLNSIKHALNRFLHGAIQLFRFLKREVYYLLISQIEYIFHPHMYHIEIYTLKEPLKRLTNQLFCKFALNEFSCYPALTLLYFLKTFVKCLHTSTFIKKSSMQQKIIYTITTYELTMSVYYVTNWRSYIIPRLKSRKYHFLIIYLGSGFHYETYVYRYPPVSHSSCSLSCNVWQLSHGWLDRVGNTNVVHLLWYEKKHTCPINKGFA